MSFANVAKASGHEKYSRKNMNNRLNERGNRLVDRLQNYTSHWLRKNSIGRCDCKLHKSFGFGKWE